MTPRVQRTRRFGFDFTGPGKGPLPLSSENKFSHSYTTGLLIVAYTTYYLY